MRRAIMLLILIIPCHLFAMEGRKALLTDQTGETTDIFVTGAKEYYKQRYVQQALPNSIYIFTSLLEYCIPIKAIVKILPTDKKLKADRIYGQDALLYEIEYRFDNQLHKIEGSLISTLPSSAKNILEALVASSYAEIDLSEINSLVFSEAPESVSISNYDNKESYVFKLMDGSHITVKNLLFHQQNYSTEGYIIGGTYVNDFYPFLPVSKGPIKMQPAFKDIVSLGLTGAISNVSTGWYTSFDCEISLQNGTEVNGKLEHIYEFSGFSGISEKGPFFCEVRKVKNIQRR